MKLVKKVNALVLGLVLLLAVGCGKEDVTVKVKEPEVVLPKCQVTEWQISEPNSLYSNRYHYNAQGKLIKKDLYRNNAPYGHIEFEYNQDNRVSKMSWLYNNALWEYSTYQYNAAGKLEMEEYFAKRTPSGPVLDSWYSYDYDTDQKLIKRSVYAPGSTTSNQHWEVTYPATNKAISKRIEMHQSGPKVGNTEEYTFDNLHTPPDLVGY